MLFYRSAVIIALLTEFGRPLCAAKRGRAGKEPEMERETRRRHKRYPSSRTQKWNFADIALFVAAVVCALAITVSGLAALVRALQAEAAAEASEAAENEPYYMTFIRGVWDILEGGRQEEDGGTSQSGAEGETDLSVYANAGGTAGALYQMLEDYPQVADILLHYDEIPEELSSLAVSNPETISFVAQYLELSGVRQDIDLSQEAAGSTVPLLLQWDTRWGYDSYGSGMIGYTGCGPTCLSMVAIYLTKDASLDPGTVAAWADQAGYYVAGSGTAWTLMSEGCGHFGLQAEELALDENVIASRLAAGQPVICTVGAGDFTKDGHFIVLTGYADGAFTVNDPNSVLRSSQTWTYERLAGQIKDLWAYTLK